ncbi:MULTISPECIES: GlcG/HbpS family heme-binding protein [unclassified Pseudomonas]|uniref:GlcG/HbpS family heme-binding protein n=1 Tax=unclassified Pseudomonas TaxID=196821 RepID=UPI0021C5CC28|nr:MULTISPECIES: heme-binding protein [unclassified Pseudomonas]MCU1723681.1 heme-binding protein [Pseudomonas sp. 5P_5.1_Bac1]MCU1731960.1 heme-binding protein [Pseudomonas sp. 20P_3.2_Bac4]MCU1744950.1 heme-binding protein [Pseudomonas sp. 20P_3.2_Bac5]
MNPLLRQQQTITLRLAMQALDAAVSFAEQAGVRVSVAILDASGQPINSAHMDGAPRPCQAIALNKALTAAGFGVSTQVWEERLQKCSTAVREGLPLQPNLALFGGGEPFLLDGQVIGAIGVSGASEALDAGCAKAAVDKVRELLDNAR